MMEMWRRGWRGWRWEWSVIGEREREIHCSFIRCVLGLYRYFLLSCCLFLYTISRYLGMYMLDLENEYIRIEAIGG